MVQIPIKGVVIPDEDKWIYDLLELDAVCPRDVQSAIRDAKGEEITFVVNSPGGEISSGGEMWYMINSCSQHTTADIVGYACSAASYLVMGADSVRMAPQALMMIHLVSSGAQGNHYDLEHEAETLRVADKAISNVYRAKTGRSNEEFLQLMENETWMDCDKALELGLIDEIIGNDTQKSVGNVKAGTLYNAFGGMLSEEVKEKIRNMVKNPGLTDQYILLQRNKLNLLKIGGIRNEI